MDRTVPPWPTNGLKPNHELNDHIANYDDDDDDGNVHPSCNPR